MAVKEQTKVDSFLTTKKYGLNDNRQCRASDAVVAELMLPLSIVEAPSFKQFTESLDPRFVVPSRST